MSKIFTICGGLFIGLLLAGAPLALFAQSEQEEVVSFGSYRGLSTLAAEFLSLGEGTSNRQTLRRLRDMLSEHPNLDINVTNRFGDTLLHELAGNCESGRGRRRRSRRGAYFSECTIRYQMVRMLHATGRLNLNPRGHMSSTPMDHASRSGNQLILHFLIDQDVPFSTDQFASLISHEYIEIIREILDQDKVSNEFMRTHSSSGYTPLANAVKVNSLPLVQIFREYMAEHDMDINEDRSRKGLIALCFSDEGGHDRTEILRYLLDNGLNSNSHVRDINTHPLFKIVEIQHSVYESGILRRLQTMERLRQVRAGRRFRPWSERQRAREINRYRSAWFERVRLLLTHGLNPNFRSSLNGTPLMRAISAGYEEYIDLLLESGADPNMANNFGPPLRTHADRSNYGERPLNQLIEFYSHAENEEDKQAAIRIFTRLADAGAELHFVGHMQETPLIQAVRRTDPQFVELFLPRLSLQQINFRPNTARRYTARDVAFEAENQQMISILREYNARCGDVCGRSLMERYENEQRRAAHQDALERLRQRRRARQMQQQSNDGRQFSRRRTAN